MPTQRRPISIMPAPYKRTVEPPVVLLSYSDTQEATIRTQSPRRSPRSMSTPNRAARGTSAPLQVRSARYVPQMPSAPLYPSLPSDSPMGGLTVSGSSVATLPATDTAVSRTPTLRSRYAIPVAPDTPAETPITDHPVPSGVAKPDLALSGSASQSGPPQSAV